MTVLFITHYADFYGANRSLLAMMVHLRDEYGIMPVVLINRKGDFIEELNKHKIPYIQSYFYMCKIEDTQPRKGIHIFLRKCITPYLFSSVKRKIRTWGEIDLFHSNSSVIDIGAYLSSELQVPHIWHIREFGLEDYNLVDIYSKKNINRKMNCAFCNVAISKSIKESVQKKYGLIPVEVIYNGIDVVSSYKKVYCQTGTVKFCVLGIISEGKNQMEILEACNFLKKREISTFSITFIGSFIDDNYRKKVESYVEEYKLSKYVKFIGFVKQPMIMLQEMDVGIISSKKEAFGRVTIEYMANDMPVIGADCGGTKELVQAQNGMLYPSGAYQKLAEKMEILIRNHAMISKMGKNARAFAETMSAKENAKNIYEIYTRVNPLMKWNR